MSESGETKDAFASRAPPTRAARVCERGRPPTLPIGVTNFGLGGAARARRRELADAAA